jgi:hypothetical protein
MNDDSEVTGGVWSRRDMTSPRRRHTTTESFLFIGFPLYLVKRSVPQGSDADAR